LFGTKRGFATSCITELGRSAGALAVQLGTAMLAAACAANLLNGLFGSSYRVDVPSSIVDSMRLTLRRCGRGPQRFSVRHVSRCTAGAAGKPADVIRNGNPDAPSTEVRDRRAITRRNDAATGIDREAAQITPFAERQDPVVFQTRADRFVVASHRGLFPRPEIIRPLAHPGRSDAAASHPV
jgi:hypothetical protein